LPSQGGVALGIWLAWAPIKEPYGRSSAEDYRQAIGAVRLRRIATLTRSGDLKGPQSGSTGVLARYAVPSWSHAIVNRKWSCDPHVRTSAESASCALDLQRTSTLPYAPKMAQSTPTARLEARLPAKVHELLKRAPEIQ